MGALEALVTYAAFLEELRAEFPKVRIVEKKGAKVSERAKQKAAARRADEKALADGVKTRAQLVKENGFLSAVKTRPNYRASKLS